MTKKGHYVIKYTGFLIDFTDIYLRGYRILITAHICNLENSKLAAILHEDMGRSGYLLHLQEQFYIILKFINFL
jgi:hypothetical protein